LCQLLKERVGGISAMKTHDAALRSERSHERGTGGTSQVTLDEIRSGPGDCGSGIDGHPQACRTTSRVGRSRHTPAHGILDGRDLASDFLFLVGV
jgi:hypothetical protein